jgi:UDP-N-acetylmuramoyl-L-alanyl-D-glutamate--2,6-diaminopimelate ligase
MSPKPVSLSATEWALLLGAQPPADWPANLTGVQPDSRRVRPGDLFVAIDGSEGDGHRFAADAVRKGAVGIVATHELSLALKVPVVQVPDARTTMVQLSRALFQHPDRDLRLTGVTGTNGKTTVVGFVRQLFEALDISCGQLGTVSYQFGQREIPARRTTPGAPDLHEYLRAMVDAGCEDCVMEVSSHALDQQRVAGLAFDCAVFTNLSQDHLDYHPDMESYFQAKRALFDFPTLRQRIVGEDVWSRRLATEFGAGVIRCGLAADCDVRADLQHADLTGLRAQVTSPWGEGLLEMTPPGEHNLRNMLQALAVCAGYGLPFDRLLAAVKNLKSAPGRLESVPSTCGKVLVDYAHTPDALASVIRLLKPLTRGTLSVVFGCGGDRDRLKRPLMVQAASLADEMILTNDNPRTEDPAQIFADMREGLRSGDVYNVIEDRRQAIAYGVGRLQADDLLLIAGKGHETVQVIGAVQLPFDDRAVAAAALAKRELSQTGSC